MSYKLKNTALDHDKRFLHRTASKMQMEPVIGGRRLRIRQSMVISDELFAHNLATLILWRGWGIVTWEKVGGEAGRKVPTKEEVMAAGYSEEAAEKIIERETRLAAEEAAAKELETAAPTLSEGGLLAPSPGNFSLWLMAVGENQIGVVKALREMGQISIREASDLANVAPVVVAEGVSEERATAFGDALSAAGAQVRVTKQGEAPVNSLVPEALVPESITPAPESKSDETEPGKLFTQATESPPAETTQVETKPHSQPKNPKSKK